MGGGAAVAAGVQILDVNGVMSRGETAGTKASLFPFFLTFSVSKILEVCRGFLSVDEGD